jgi:O-antigen biosynthesis protein
MRKTFQYLSGLYRGRRVPSITLESALRFAKNRLITKPYVAVRKNALTFVPFRNPARVSVVPAERLPDYVIWGVIDWKFRHQRPQQLARALADTGRRVFYISSNFRADRRAGFAVEDVTGDGNLFQVKLFLRKPQIIYSSCPDEKAIAQLRRGLGRLLAWSQSTRTVSLVQHPFWYQIASSLPNNRVIYDCIDDHAGFGNNSSEVLSLEHQLFKYSDLTVVTSGWLKEIASSHSGRVVLIRNAADFSYFQKKPRQIYSDPDGRPLIGYYGAIANWLDLDLVAAVAERFPYCTLLLAGADTIGARRRLAHYENIRFTGEVAYADLTYYLHAFDVCLLPFKIIPLTLATNPVKVYEYLGAGKPVVSVNLPEMAEFSGLVHIADSPDEFLSKIEHVLAENCDERAIQSRKQFSEGQTWKHRATDLVENAEKSLYEPLVSIIIVTFNNVEFTIQCLESVEIHSDYQNIEVIVVDNASTDSTRDYLEKWAGSASARRVIYNSENRGFAAANNQGLADARGEYLVMLNNDTVVTSGWLRTLYRHLKQNSDIGLLGPVTNNIGNEAKVNIKYKNLDQMHPAAAEYVRKNIGETFDLRTVAFFCVMLSRNVYDRVGPLDEAYGLGFFEDDDYCRRVQQIGLKVVCARDVFVHHHLSASFLKLDAQIRRKLFADNRKIYEKKWGAWVPHRTSQKKSDRRLAPFFISRK